MIGRFEGGVRIWGNDGKAAFSELGRIPTDYPTDGIAVADVNRDGLPDLLLTASNFEGEVWLNQGNGRFAASDQRLNADGGRHVVAADFDHEIGASRWRCKHPTLRQLLS